MATIGFIGSGNIGQAFAQRAIAVGHNVVMSNSRGPKTLARLVTALGQRVRAATVTAAAEAADIVVVAIPLQILQAGAC
jgi:predicted dinucleotide-binding enzyme